jgi:hypothetical protein
VYIGHLGIALGGKGLWRSAPLWLLILAAQAPDWIDAAGCMTGSEPSGMWSHSIPAVLALSVGLGLLTLIVSRDWRLAGLVALGVISHLLVDYVTGAKPTWPRGPLIGLRLYQHPGWEFVAETMVIFVGWLAYQRSWPAASRRTPLVVLLVCLLTIQLAGDIKAAVLPSSSKCQWSLPRAFAPAAMVPRR